MKCRKCGETFVKSKMPPTWSSVTHKVKIDRSAYYITVGLVDGKPRELAIIEAKAENAMIRQWAIAVSELLKRGATMRDLMGLFAWAQFNPQGLTDNPGINVAKSVTDYVVRWMDSKWGAK